MIPANFDYHRASSVDEAVSLLKEFGDEAKLLAGGHSLLPVMKLRLNTPSNLIDISKLPELKYIKEDGGNIAIGAGTTHYMIESSTLIKSKAPLLSQAAAAIGDVQVRNMGTIGGSLAHADPAADWPAAILATEAKIVVKGPAGERTIAASDFFTGLFTTALKAGEMITEIRVPAHPGNTGASYMKFAQPASRFAIVGCAALVTKKGGVCDKVRVAFTGAADYAFRDAAVENALTGKAPDEANIAAAAEKAAEGMDLLSDHFASEDYRRHLAKVYARRALTQAAS
jgi:carbon-monoxide dehydrogenase medium subunit